MFKSAITKKYQNMNFATALIVFCLGIAPTNAARANVEFSVDFVAASTGDFLSGTFTTNNALNQIVSYNITAPQVGAFSGFDYTPVDSVVTASVLPSQYFQIDSVGFATELRIYFASSLTETGGVVAPSYSYEAEASSGGIRYLSGAVVPAVSGVPEPSTWAMMLLGLGGIGMLAWQKSRGAAALSLITA